MLAVSTGLRMAMMASGQQADVDSVAPDAPKVSAALVEVLRQYPATASRRRLWTPPLWRRWGSRAPRAPLAGALLKGGGCVAHPLTSGPPVPSKLHECYHAPPPPGMGSLTDVRGTPPPLCEIFCSTVCILFGVCYAP